MTSLIYSIFVMGVIVTVPFLLGFWCGKLYHGMKNER